MKTEQKFILESWALIFFKIGLRNFNPSVETIPENDPIITEPTGLETTSATAPIATPPASDAFWM